MKLLHTLTCLLVVCLCFPCKLCCQDVIKGEVTDIDTKEPLIGANVIIKGTTTGTVTDYDGRFELKAKDGLPTTLSISYLGYTETEIEVTSVGDRIAIQLKENAIVTDVVEVTGQRISDKQKAAPLTIETMDLLAIKETPSDNFYDGLGSMKGVDLTAASLGFKIVNTRGFNSTSPVRSLQIIDGVDNQAPGLNFSLGNFLGSSELDVLKVDLIVGASSAFYGPNAFNGVISMETKNPFYQKGLSAMVKAGERNLFEGAIRWGDAIKNKAGNDFMAYKLNFSYLQADDWVADNDDPVFDTRTDRTNPGRWDQVNTYGDEYFSGNDFSTNNPWDLPGLGIFHRTGYREQDLVDYGTENIKANLGLYFRLNPSKLDQSPELILASSYGAGTTVYQGDNRFSLRNITFNQHKLEVRQRDKWFFRAYTTRTGAGDSYDPYFTALQLQNTVKSNGVWSADYVKYWGDNVVPKMKKLGYPQVQIVIGPNGEIIASFDNEAADQWKIDFRDSLIHWHTLAQNVANTTTRGNAQPYLEPGTQRFKDAFDDITGRERSEGGTKFFDNSALYHVQGEYAFTPGFVDQIKVGGNYRLYTPESRGSVFYDTAGIEITNSEVGFYAGAEHEFFDKKLKAQLTARVDKNENFRTLFSPAASLVWKPRANNFLRMSFSSAIRNPTLTDQYLFLNVGRATLSGNLDGVQNLVTIESLRDYLSTLSPSALDSFNIAGVQPEEVKTFENRVSYYDLQFLLY